MVCVVPKGMLPPFKLRAGSLSLDDLTGVPTISLDAQDPVGMLLSQLARESSAGLDHYVTVQTYHTALAMAQPSSSVSLSIPMAVPSTGMITRNGTAVTS